LIGALLQLGGRLTTDAEASFEPDSSDVTSYVIRRCSLATAARGRRFRQNVGPPTVGSQILTDFRRCSCRKDALT